MQNILIIIFLILSIILQVTLFSFLDFRGVTPNLVLIVVLFLVVWKRFERIWWIIVLTGLIMDLMIGLPLGLASLSLVTVSYLTNGFNRRIFSQVKWWTVSSLVITGTLIYNLLIFILSKAFQFDIVFSLSHLLIEIIYNFLISSLIYVGSRKIFR